MVRSAARRCTSATSAAIMGPTILKEFPEVEDFLRMTGRGPTHSGV